jgi:hypothetical protein
MTNAAWREDEIRLVVQQLASGDRTGGMAAPADKRPQGSTSAGMAGGATTGDH